MTSKKSSAIPDLHALHRWYEKHERLVAPVAFIAGFIFDNLTLTRVDLWLDNLVILVYLVLTGACIIILNLNAAGRFKNRFTEEYGEFLPLVMQFALGNLFSGFLVFYVCSASLAGSWLFLLLLAGIFIGNERFRKWYGRFVFQMSIFFIALFSYAVFVVPILIKDIGPCVFLLSGFLSIAVLGIIIYALSLALPGRIRQSRRLLAASIGGIYACFNILYFANIIPPIPLALKASGIYHTVAPNKNGGYTIQYEQPAWYEFYRSSARIFHRVGDGPVYSFSAVFAPTDFRVKILHRWAYLDEEAHEWIVANEIPLTVRGGRDGGWRGYTYKKNIKPGKWRVDVITARGQILGRTVFAVEDIQMPPELNVKNE